MKKELKEILNKIDREDIDNFLIGLLTYNKNIMNDFRCRFVNYFPSIKKEEYENKIWESIRSLYGKNGYIDYSSCREYTHHMYGFIHESKNLLESKNYESSFDILEIILDSIPDTDIDDSNGSTGEVANDCIEVIEDILGYSLVSDDMVCVRILNYILEEIKTGRLYNYGIELYPLLDYFIDEVKYLSNIKDTLNEYINSHDEDNYIRSKYIGMLDKINEIEVE